MLEFLLTSLVIILLPGAGVLYTVAVGLGKGWRASVFAAFGCTLGILPHIAASIAGLAALLHASAVAFQVVKFIGVAYLFYMAWGVYRDERTWRISDRRSSVRPTKVVTDGFLLNVLNPKLSLFFLAFLPQFVPDADPGAAAAMLELAGLFMLLTFIVFTGYGALASAARWHVVTKPRVVAWLKRGFAGAFGILGLRLALADR